MLPFVAEEFPVQRVRTAETGARHVCRELKARPPRAQHQKGMVEMMLVGSLAETVTVFSRPRGGCFVKVRTLPRAVSSGLLRQQTPHTCREYVRSPPVVY